MNEDTALTERTEDLLRQVDRTVDERIEARERDRRQRESDRLTLSQPFERAASGWDGLIWGTGQDEFSLTRATQLALGLAKPDSRTHGFEARACAAEFDRCDRELSDTTLRSMAAATGAGGGFLLPSTLSAEIIKDLEDMTIATALGARTLPGLRGSVSWSKEDDTAGVEWLDTEAFASASDQTPTVSQISMKPHVCVSMVKLSWSMINQTPASVETWLRGQLTRKVARELDRVVFLGTGAESQPLGLYNLTGTGSVDFTSATFSTATGTAIKSFRLMLQTLRRNQVGMGARVGWAGEPRGLEAQEACRDADGNFMISPASPAFLDAKRFGTAQLNATDTTALRLAVGDWSQCWIGQFATLAVAASDSHSTDFAQGAARLRALGAWDVAFTDPANFVLASNLDLADFGS